MKKIIKSLMVTVFCMMLTVAFAACGSNQEDDSKTGKNQDTVMFTDDCGREVEIPTEITKVAPSGSVSQMIITSIAPETLVGIANEPGEAEMKYLPEGVADLPIFGQFYGSKANLNMEALLAAEPQIVIDIGDKKDTQKEDMDSIQEQTGLPVIFIESSLNEMPDAYRTLGELLNKEDKGEEMASYIEDTVKTAEKNSAEIKETKTVYYGGGSEGFDCNAKGSVQADVIELIGAENAIEVEEVNDKGGGNLINMEELYSADPDVIVLSDDGSYDVATENEQWAELNAVKDGAIYEIPGEPYCWMSQPPSVNRVIGIWWLGNLVYPEIYDYDMVEKTKEFYSLFYNYDLTDDEAKELLANSTLK